MQQHSETPVREALRALHKQIRTTGADLGGEIFAESQAAQGSIVAQQRLYEHWLKQDAWYLRDDALPLLLGVDPEEWPELRDREPIRSSEALAWEVVQASVRDTDQPMVTNRNAPEDLWKVRTSDFYRWAKQADIAVPNPLEQLIQFIATVVQQEDPDAIGAADVAATAQQTVLGAALSVLAAWPADCSDRQGRIDAARIAALVERKAPLWFTNARAPMSAQAMTQLIDEWLSKVPR